MPLNHTDSEAPVILIMGQAGVGKSHFVNTAIGNDVAQVRDSLECDARPPELFLSKHERPIYLVDTPGFDDVSRDDKSMLKYILDWFHDKGRESLPNAKFGGILYLVEAGQRNLPMFHDFKQIPVIGERLLVVGTKVGKSWRSEVESNFEDSNASAREIIDALLRKSKDMDEVALQKCLDEMEKLVLKKSGKKSKGFFAIFSGLFSRK